MKKQIIVLLVTFVSVHFLSCNGDEQLFSKPHNEEKMNEIVSLNFLCDTITLQNTSFQGYTAIYANRIYFLDKYFCWLYEFDSSLNTLHQYYGQGRSRKELPFKEIHAYTIDSYGNHYASSDRILIKMTNNLQNHEEQLFMPTFDFYVNAFKRSSTYGLLYGDLCFKVFGNNMYFNVIGSTRDINPLSKVWYEKSRIIMRADVNTGDINGLLGKVSPNIPLYTAFFAYTFDMDSEGNFYVNYYADTLMYKYNNDYKLIKAFGYDGINIKRDYNRLNSLANEDEISVVGKEEITTKGYFTSVSVANNYLFRVYCTGGENNQDRMQIYKDETLLGDVLIPNQFKVCGYIEPYFYTNIICNEDAEQMYVYRFKISE